MPDLLLEVGCEELPASFVMTACVDLRDRIRAKLDEAGLPSDEGKVYGTPRRLIVSLGGIPDRQEDTEKVSRGPAKQAAYGPDGLATKALEGFCRGQGVEPADAYVDGDYVWVRKQVQGRRAVEVLSEVLPSAITSLTFAKTMRWAGHRLRFARPIRWILASFGGECVPFLVEVVTSGLTSRGHRFNFPDEFEARTIQELLEGLREREVEPDGGERARRIREGVAHVSGGRAEANEDLVEENAYLTEWPTAIAGTFDSKFLELPDPVLTTVMAKHERFFPVRAADGKLTNEFVSIRNGGEDEVVAMGNAWVLNARCGDAKFFFDEDRKYTLDEFLERTRGIVFQAELGTVRDRADRLERLCAEIARHLECDDETIGQAAQAGKYAKADLSTGLVGELDELQGAIGAIYAQREGLSDAVCDAIRDQYSTRADGSVSFAVALADQLDKLAGYLGLGLVPSGSSDPFGLRRAAGITMELVLKTEGCCLALDGLLEFAAEGYARKIDSVEVLAAAREILKQRCETLFPDVRQDVLDAVLAEQAVVFRPSKLAKRLSLMSWLAEQIEFVQSATRPLNIVAAADKKGIHPVALKIEKLQSDEAVALLEAARSMPCDTDTTIVKLKEPVDAFFESTMVMVDDDEVRDARLAMLREVCEVLLRVGDFSKLVIAG